MKFSERLRSLGFESYNAYLESELWYSFRRKWMASSETKKECEVCSSTRIQLHHVEYCRLGQELLTDIMPLCRVHHVQVHEWLKANKKMVNASPTAVRKIKAKNPVAETVKPKRAKKERNNSRTYKPNACRADGCKQHAKKNQTFCKSCKKRLVKDVPNPMRKVFKTKQQEAADAAAKSLAEYRASRGFKHLSPRGIVHVPGSFPLPFSNGNKRSKKAKRWK